MKTPNLPDLPNAKEAIANAEKALAELERATAQPRRKRSTGAVTTAKAKPAKATPEQIGSKAINEGRAKVLRPRSVKNFERSKSK